MLLPSDIPQGVADALGYLQHHLQELTERQHVSENNINSTLAALTAQLQQLTQLVANPPLSLPAVLNTPPSPVPSPPVSPSPAPLTRQTCPKLSCPPDFNGECHNGHAFLNSCSLYIRLAPEQFQDEQKRFEQQFWLHFFPANAKADAINALEGTSYHQGNRTVDDYLDSFQALVSDAGYTDPRTLVVKF